MGISPPLGQVGTIWVTLEGATLKNTERCREIMQILFEKGVFNIRNGSVELHFDNDGFLQVIKSHSETYRRNKESEPLLKMYEGASIKTLDSSATAALNQHIVEKQTA